MTESSLIVHWLTEEAGLIKTVAKGARRAKSSFAGRIDLFIDAELEWTRSSRSELHALREVSVVDFRQGLRKSYRDAVIAAYFGQLLEQVLELDHPV
ncbi:DNA repair protein RecO, partial [Akkermansiaceae bacterium]|nr:DNA repair protein RecO [Akkermansiaceae bacterium]